MAMSIICADAVRSCPETTTLVIEGKFASAKLIIKAVLSRPDLMPRDERLNRPPR